MPSVALVLVSIRPYRRHFLKLSGFARNFADLFQTQLQTPLTDTVSDFGVMGGCVVPRIVELVNLVMLFLKPRTTFHVYVRMTLLRVFIKQWHCQQGSRQCRSSPWLPDSSCWRPVAMQVWRHVRSWSVHKDWT